MTNTASKRSFNAWPFSIVGFFGLAIVAAVVWVVFCIGHGTDLVAADYYEQEVAYQDQLDRMERVRDLSGRAGVTYRMEENSILIQLPTEHASAGLQGMIHLYRPSQANLDKTLPVKVTNAGEQLLDASTLLPGLWEVRVQWTALGQEFFLNEKLTIANPSR